MVINCRSVCNKTDKFRTLIELIQPHVVVAIETWLEEGYTEREVTIDGYVMHRRDRNKHGGGIMVGIKKEVRGTVIWKENDVEMMGLRLNAGGGVFHLIAVYNPPSGGEETMMRLEERLSELKREDTVIVAGDLNLPAARWEAGGEGLGKSKSQKIVTSIMNQGYAQVVREGTRKTRTGGNNILDVMLVRPKELLIKTEIIDGISDHRVPIVKLMLGTAPIMEGERKIWNYKRANALEVKSLFESKYNNWVDGCSDDIEEIWQDFKMVCKKIREKCVPSKVLVKNNDPPYYNKKVKILKMKCRKVYNKEKGNGEIGTERIKEIRKALEKAKGEAKEKFLDNMFDKGDMQGSWNKMYKFVGGMKGNVGSIPTLSDAKGKEWDTDVSKATALNNHYGETFTKRGRDRYTMQGQIRKGEDNCVSRKEIWQVIRKLKNGKSVGLDGISNDLVKLAGKSILPYLEVIVNLSIRTGKLPKDWKEALVVPIFKGGERGKLVNYRPVSLTSAICKIVERVIDGRIKMKIDEKGGLTGVQHGFRKEHSCETQLLGFVTDLAEVLDRDGRVDAVFLDYEKAFDKVDHEILMGKLWERIDDIQIVNWIGNFLENRTQKVRVGNAKSKEREVTSGVTQGSVLGPLLFNIFIDDMSEGLESKTRLFADDCVIYRKINEVEDEHILQNDLNRIGDWVNRNKMSLNINKCKIVSFGGKMERSGTNYEMQGIKLEKVEKYKYLGVVLKHDLEWKEQVARLTKKGINALNFIMRQLKGMSIEIKEKAYITMIRPMVEYAAAVWDPYRTGEVKDIEKVQRIAARRVTGRVKKRRKVVNEKGVEEQVLESPTEMIEELGWKPLRLRRKIDRLSNFYRAWQGTGGWKEIHEKIIKDKREHNIRRKHDRQVIVKGSKRDVGKYAFLNRTGIEWNDLDGKVFKDLGNGVKEFRARIEEVGFEE